MPRVGQKALTMSFAQQHARVSTKEFNMGRKAIIAICKVVFSFKGVVEGTRPMNLIIVQIDPASSPLSPTTKVDHKDSVVEPLDASHP